MRQCADQNGGQDGSGDLAQSHLEALVDPVGAVIRSENDQGNDDDEEQERPKIFRREYFF
jgi:hypothetical protein